MGRLHFNTVSVAAITLQTLAKSFRVPEWAGSPILAVADVSLHVASGELLALVGPSGCGKTTLLRLIAGLEEPDRGTIALDGQTQQGVPPGQREVGMVFQTLALYPHMTARANMELGLKLRQAPPAEMNARVTEVAQWLGLTECLARRPAELSSGQRQRVALGRALVRQPKVLLLDEPFANLDAPLRRELRREVQRLQRALNLTVILVTHDQAEALALGQRVAVMNAGKLEQVAEPEVLRTRPASPFVKEFLNPAML